jgi:hypothetical protein
VAKSAVFIVICLLKDRVPSPKMVKDCAGKQIETANQVTVAKSAVSFVIHLLRDRVLSPKMVKDCAGEQIETANQV